MPVTIREAVREDSEQIYRFICDLAEYENALDKVLCSAASLAKGLFESIWAHTTMPRAALHGLCSSISTMTRNVRRRY